jgi:hypothetical protein
MSKVNVEKNNNKNKTKTATTTLFHGPILLGLLAVAY